MACGTLAALGLTATGAGVNEYANIDTRGKMNDLVGAEMRRNLGYQRQANQAANQSIDLSTPGAAQHQIQQGQQQLSALQNQVQGVPITTSTPLVQGLGQQDSAVQTGLANRAAANLGGYSNYGLQQYLKDADANNQLGVIGSNARGWANILPTQLQEAQQSDGGLQALGSLLGMAGMLTGIGSLASAPMGVANGAQLAGMGAGLGPITAASAAALPASTLASGAAAWAPWLTDSTMAGFGYGGLGSLATTPLAF